MTIGIKKLTILTGFNASGKSSSIQPLLLLSQGLRESRSPTKFALNGALVRLGTVGDIIPSGGNGADTSFTVSDLCAEIAWTLVAQAGERLLRCSAVIHSQSDRSMLSDRTTINDDNEAPILTHLRNLAYLSAIRDGGAEAYPIPDLNCYRLGDVGTDGRFAAFLYDQGVDNEVSVERRFGAEEGTSLRKQLDAWLGTLFPGAQANVQAMPLVSLMSLQFRLSEIGTWRRPSNVGYGLSYAFPILISLLTADRDQIVVIDSPEAHLHPSAQSQMGKLLAHFAAAGVQVIVETHSDHLLNGARIAVKEGKLSPSDIAIHFFNGASEEDHGIVSPIVDKAGRISDWPDGFFDQTEKDLSELAY